MGNIGSHSGQFNSHQEDKLLTKLSSYNKNLASKYTETSKAEAQQHQQIKVLPTLESRHRLRHTNNGEILHSGGTLSGRCQTRLQKVPSRTYSPTQRFSFDLTSTESHQYQNDSAQKSFDDKFKLHRSEPDLRCPSLGGPERRETKIRRKYKAPAPPVNKEIQGKSANWEKNIGDSSRRARLFKTQFESKKELSQANSFEKAAENNSDIVEEQITVRENVNYLQLRATDRLTTAAKENDATELDDLYQFSDNAIQPKLEANNESVIERRFVRGEPSGKESSTSETSPILGNPTRKPTEFYFGMQREHLKSEDDEDSSTIALHLRPVLPRKPTQIPRFSPAAAWKLLDSRSQDSGISGDARPPVSFSWTPQQDLEDDSSIDDAIGEEPQSPVTQQRSYVFSLSLPRDYQAAPFLATSNKPGVSSLGRLKKSVSGVLNTLSIKRELEKRAFTKDNSNWFFTRSAPNSLNESSLEMPEAFFPHITSTARRIYLPNTIIRTSSTENNKKPATVLSQSCEELQVPESLRDSKTVLDVPWYKERRHQKTKKFTFQSTVRQIERKRMADRLSKEAERKEKQRLRELEVMQRVEEEFQRKRAKEKANIRQQLRLYSMDDIECCASLPPDLNVKAEKREEPDGALSSSESSLASSPIFQKSVDKGKHFENSIAGRLTKELSEYRQMQRDYKEYRGSIKYFPEDKTRRQTIVHPEVNCSTSYIKGSNLERANYRKSFANGIRNRKSMGSNEFSDNQYNYSPNTHHNRQSPTTRF